MFVFRRREEKPQSYISKVQIPEVFVETQNTKVQQHLPAEHFYSISYIHVFHISAAS